MDVRQLKDKASQLFTKGKFAKAAEAYEEYCAADRKDHQSRLRCGDAWAKAGKKDKAIIAYSQAAEGFAKDGFLPRAIAASKLVLELDPAHKGVQKMLADLYAQKSGGARKAAAAPAPEMEISRKVEAPVSSTFANRKDAIDLDAPVAAPAKPRGFVPTKQEAPSPMNRADALELPEYEIPMDDGSSSVGGMSAHKGPSPQRRADAIEIEAEAKTESGPRALTATAIDIELSAGQPVTGEVEVPIEGQALPDADQLPPELQVAQPLAPAATFELDVPPPPPPPARAAASAVYDLTDAIPEARPSAPTFELTEVVPDAAPPPPAPRPAPPEAVLVGEALPEPVEPVVDVALEVAVATPQPPPPPPEPSAMHVTVGAPTPPPDDEPIALTRVRSRPAEGARPEAALSAAAPVSFDVTVVPDAPAAAPSLDVAAAVEPASERSPLPPAVGDAATAPPAIRPVAAETALPPGLKPKRSEPATAPAEVPASSPSGSRIWLPPGFGPATPRADDGSGLPAAAPASSAPALPTPADVTTDLERSLHAFMQFDPDAPISASASPASAAPPRPPAPQAAPPPRASFTELDLEGDSLLHAVEAAAAIAAPATTAVVEEALEAPDEPRTEPGALPKIPLFSDLPEDAFIALFEKCPLQRFDEGQLVFEQGDKADAFYVICAGRARVFRTDGDARKDLATLDEGSFFGEMALLSDAPRSASVEAAAEDTQVLAISAEILTELSAAHPSVSTALKKFCRQRMLSNLMNHAPLFAPFNRNDRRELVQKFRARDVNRGDVLVKEGHSSDGLYVVLSGEVEVEAQGARIASLKEGQVFGEMSLLTRSPASATVRAVRHTSLLRLPKQDFDALILSHPQVLEHVSELIDSRKKADVRRQAERS